MCSAADDPTQHDAPASHDYTFPQTCWCCGRDLPPWPDACGCHLMGQHDYARIASEGPHAPTGEPPLSRDGTQLPPRKRSTPGYL